MSPRHASCCDTYDTLRAVILRHASCCAVILTTRFVL